MPTVDDEESLSDVNKQFKPEMEEQKLGLLGTEGAGKCEATPEFGESIVSAGRERDETVLLEDKPVADGEDGVFQNHVDGTGPEFAADMIEMPVAVAEEAAVEGGGEVIASQGGDSFFEIKGEEGANRVDDAKGAVVTDTDGGTVFSESQVDNKGDELQIDTKLKMEFGEEFATVVESELEMVVIDSESPMDGEREEIPADPQLEKTVENESKTVVGPKTEEADTGVGNEQQSSELQMSAGGSELNTIIEGMEMWKDESEKVLDDERNVLAVGGVGNESANTFAVHINAKSVQGDQVNEEKVDVVLNDSEAGTGKYSTGVGEEDGDPGITEEIPLNAVTMDGDMIFEANESTVNVSEHEQVHESSDAVEYFGGDEGCEHADDKDVASKGSLLPGNEKVNDENLGTKVSGDDKLDEHLNVADYKEDAIVKEELPSGDIKPETEAIMELESTRNDVVEIKSIDAEVEIGTGTNFTADKTPDEDGKLEMDDTVSDVDEPGQDMSDSPAALKEGDETMVAKEEIGTQDTEMEPETEMTESGKTSSGKRKRGNLSKSPSISKPTGKSSSRKTVGDDVCFICFDGGELVLCDRRGCPKAYHPSCVDRDEAFFKSKGSWNCGWHLCSNCGKGARYMCYTCTFSLCKSCIKDFVILCVRGNKGFCETCMRTVRLIENNERGNQDTPVDFDDRSSWEYLFKDYYIELKAKLSLSTVEIAEAKNPWKGANMSGRSKQESSEAQPDANDGGSGSENSIENSENVRPKRRKIRKQSKPLPKTEELIGTGAVSGDKAISSSDGSEWVSKELLEFVSHMKDGDTSVLSQFDVQALLLEYIKRNKLRDPRRKSQIICDARLENLFGKPRVGHFEMLKLLESHFLVRDEQNDDFQGSVVDTENSQLDIDVGAESLTKGSRDRKRKSRRKSDCRGPQSNLDDFAAIDMHNIGLIYLRRKLMEDLLEDVETFHDKVIGTFVRIRISGSNQKQDLYRLVQVVGTTKVAEPYKVGKRTTDIMVEILNLDKTEIISIDTISNQEFTEEECKRLRQSIKCGLISRLTVGEILDKTMEMKVARVNDWLESETLRLSHLRDRASDLGRRKELRECVEKLQLLKTPEERRRRLEEIPEIHADPKMDPSYESDERESENEDTRQDAFTRSRGSGFNRRGRGPISPGSDNSVKDSWSGAGKATPSRDLPGSNFTINSSHIGEIVNENSWNLERDKETQDPNNSDKKNFATKVESAERALRNVNQSESFSGVASIPSRGSNSAGVVEPAVKINESEKMWQYQDPSGKVQGPFSIVQLRKWNNTGYFPANLRIWQNTEKKENSILLADALVGKIPKVVPAADSMLPAEHSGLHQEKERSIVDQSSGRSNLHADKWSGNDTPSLPSPTPEQSNSGLLAGAVQSPAVNGVLPSPTAVLSSIGTHSPAPASVLSSVVQTSAFSPTPNSQQGTPTGSTAYLHTQSTTMNEPNVSLHGLSPATVQSVQALASQNLQSDAQIWGSSSAQSGQTQGYGWTTSNVQNTSGVQSDVWRPPQNSQPAMHHPATPNASWAIGLAENNMSMGMRPQNPNVSWGTMQANPNMPPVQANPNVGWGNPPPGNTNVNWGPGNQVPPSANTPGWVPPPGNTGANIQGIFPGNANPGWVANQGWGAPPVQGPAPGNGWGPSSGNAGPPVQGPGPGNGNNTNQGWAPWGGEQNHGGGQFLGQRGAQSRDSGFSGGRPWNGGQSSVGDGGPMLSKWEKPCPFNANGRCKKGARCDFLHT